MSITVQQVVDGARRYLGDQNPARNVVNHYTFDGTIGTVLFQYPLSTIREGSRFSAGLQTFYVWSVDDSSNTATVTVDQGDPDGLIPDNTVVYVNPRYTAWEIFNAANDELNSLSAPANGLYQVKTVEFPYNAARVGFDLGSATDIMSIYDVRTQLPGPYKTWPRLLPTMYRLQRNADTTDFPSGYAISLFEHGYQSYPVQVTYKAAYGQFAMITDTTATVGLQDTAVDLLFTGSAIRCLAGAEVARNDIDVQSDVRRATEVPAGAIANSVNSLLRTHQVRVVEEATRLMSLWPDFRGD